MSGVALLPPAITASLERADLAVQTPDVAQKQRNHCGEQGTDGDQQRRQVVAQPAM